MKEKKKKTNIIPILGVIAYALYFIMYILIQVYNVSFGNYYYQTFFHTTILSILKILLLYGLIVAYLCINISNSKKKPIQVFSIILFIVLLILLVTNIISTINYISFAFKYVGNKIYAMSNILSDILVILYLVVTEISLLGLMIKKPIAYKVLPIISIVLLGISLLFSILSGFIYTIMGSNIRAFITSALNFLLQLFYFGFNTSFILTLRSNLKEIKLSLF